MCSLVKKYFSFVFPVERPEACHIWLESTSVDVARGGATCMRASFQDIVYSSMYGFNALSHSPAPGLYDKKWRRVWYLGVVVARRWDNNNDNGFSFWEKRGTWLVQLNTHFLFSASTATKVGPCTGKFYSTADPYEVRTVATSHQHKNTIIILMVL